MVFLSLARPKWYMSCPVASRNRDFVTRKPGSDWLRDAIVKRTGRNVSYKGVCLIRDVTKLSRDHGKVHSPLSIVHRPLSTVHRPSSSPGFSICLFTNSSKTSDTFIATVSVYMHIICFSSFLTVGNILHLCIYCNCFNFTAVVFPFLSSPWGSVYRFLYSIFRF